MRKHLALLTAAGFLSTAATLGSAQVVTPIVHQANLNWDIFVPSGDPVDDFDIILQNPNWVPPNVYTGSLGFPQYDVQYGDFNLGNPGNETKLHFKGRTFNAGQIAHVGAYMYGSGLILDSYFTRGNTRVAPSIGLPYELTFVTPPLSADPGRLWMSLRGNSGFFNDMPAGTQLELINIRTFANIPDGVLGLSELNPELDLSTLAAYETVPSVTAAPLTESFFDVFVALNPNQGPQWESLLVGDLRMTLPNTTPTQFGRFWNLNAQCPEPAMFVTAVCGAGMLLMRRRM